MVTRKSICFISSFLIWTLLVSNNLNAQNIGLPKYTSSDQIIRHTAYTLYYNETHEQASWVAYKLTSSHVYGPHKRTNDFRTDPAVKTGSASPADYKRSGYDRGHLAPAGDMKWSLTAMSESFYMSNMSPQKPGFNRGIWKRLESKVRNWAMENEEIFVVTGAILSGSYATIGNNRVSVPLCYYKVILDYKEPELKGIGFILPNEKSSRSLSSFATTIDEVEHRTGIDFYHALPDDIEEYIESTVDVSKWSLRSSSRYFRNLPNGSLRKHLESASVVQCLSTPVKKIVIPGFPILLFNHNPGHLQRTF